MGDRFDDGKPSSGSGASTSISFQGCPTSNFSFDFSLAEDYFLIIDSIRSSGISNIPEEAFRRISRGYPINGLRRQFCLWGVLFVFLIPFSRENSKTVFFLPEFLMKNVSCVKYCSSHYWGYDNSPPLVSPA
jgi:hypothetical protein